MFDSVLEQQKIQKANELRKNGLNPYAHFLKKDMSIKEFRDKFAYVKEQDEQKDESVSVFISGRVKLLRIAGKSVFANIEDELSNIQIYFNKDILGDEYYSIIKKNLEVGDIILVSGYPFTTKTGEFSLHVRTLTIATKAITPLPEKYHGLTDIEQRYRKDT